MSASKPRTTPHISDFSSHPAHAEFRKGYFEDEGKAARLCREYRAMGIR